MESEKTPFASIPVPQYTFLGRSHQSPKLKIKKLHCCLCATLLGILIIALVIIFSFYQISNYDKKNEVENLGNSNKLSELKLPLQDENYNEHLLTNITNQKEAFEVGEKSLKEKEELENFILTAPIDSPEFRHQLATYTSEDAQELSKLGFVLNAGTRKIVKCFPYNTTWNNTFYKPERWSFQLFSKWVPKNVKENISFECFKSPYRTVHGTCNNLEKNKSWGAAMQPFRRILLPKYEDCVSEPRRAKDGGELPSARNVSLTIHRPVFKNDINFTVMLAVWGQFIDHDITATAISKAKNNIAISCCEAKFKHPECYPIFIEKNDPLNKKFNLKCMDFVRSAPAPTLAFGPREQLNQVTSFLDGSVIYGSDENLMNELRSFKRGELKMLNTSFGELLPISNNPNDGCNRGKEIQRGRYCFMSGDARSNENLLLTSMHLLFARQHNLIARELARINSKWSDEKIFQESRKIVGAQIQHITYNEFLPSIIPRQILIRLNMTLKNSGYFEHYNFSLNPTIANSFASAAFRFGHTLLPGLMQFLHNNASREEYVELHKMLFNPFPLYETEFLENIIKSVSTTFMQKADVYFNKELTQKLFKKKEKDACGLDLVALNIQRGRDHGLPSYPNWVEICGLPRPTSFEDLKSKFEADTLKQMKKLYKSIEDLDLYTGGLAEVPINGGLVGPTITCILADQFFRLKSGDRYWYEINETPQRFTLEQLTEIRKTTLAKIICKTSLVEKSQPYLMKNIGTENELKSCQEFDYPDFKHWKE